MAYKLSDIFIGNFPKGQSYGACPDVYNARYNLKGHNGQDFLCPSMTPVLAAAEGYVSEFGFDKAAYGNYLKIVHDGYLTIYGHLNDYTIKQNEKVIQGQLIGHSNNTGLSDVPHLHFGIAPCDGAGNKTQKDNGYGGYIDPMGSSCIWEIVGLSAPVNPSEAETKIQIPSLEYTTGTSATASLKVITTYLIKHGLNDYLVAQGKSPIDLVANPSDSEVGAKIVQFLTDNHVDQTEVTLPLNKEVGYTGSVEYKTASSQGKLEYVQKPKTQKKTVFLSKFWTAFRDFTFTQP